MRTWLRDLPIDRKLMFIMMLTLGASLLIASLTYVLSDSLSTYRSSKAELAGLAGIVANNSVSALSFGDAEVAEETLESLTSTENVVLGCLLTAEGEVLARYGHDQGAARCPGPGADPHPPRFESGGIAVLQPVRFKGETLGAVYLRSDLSRLTARVGPYLLGTLLALGTSGAIGLLLSARLKNWITNPILRLADTVAQVSASQDYSARVSGASRDEVGALMQGFNGMLEQIQLRDAELRRAHDELEVRVADRTAELEVARDAAQAASRAKSEFLANMSHEIRTPLNSVMGFTELTLRTELGEEQRDYLGTVHESAESLLGILNDILDFSKIEAGKLDIEQVPFNVFDTVEDTLVSQAVRAEQKGLELACYVDPELPSPLIGDPGRLRQVITNLVSNAIKFTERGEVVVRVEAESIRGDRALLRFEVRDTGIGIEEAEVERLFEPFEQADTSTTRRFGGTGLGLPISRQLVDLMGGELSARGVPGEGSVFSFTVPFQVPERVRDAPRGASEALEGSRLLIVDDNESNCRILEEIARARGMTPDTALSADEGFRGLVRAFESGDRHRILLSDVHMPGRDGFDFVEQVRADDRFDDLEIVFLTSAGQHGDLGRCETLRAARLVKPVRQAELLQVMSRLLRRGAGERSEPRREARLREPQWEGTLPPLRILLVEDSAANRKVALAVLGGQGHDIAVAENGREALERLAERDFDVVLMDVQMPEMDGLEATAELRRREAERNRHTPVIALTAHALQGDREKCLAAGMDDYVPKPIRRDELFAALARVTRSRPAAC